MLLKECAHGVRMDVVVQDRLPVVQQAADVLKAFSFEPASVGSREPLLHSISVLLWYVARERSSEDYLTVTCLVEERHTRFQSMRHRELVLNEQQPMQECARLEVQRLVHRVLRGPHVEG